MYNFFIEPSQIQGNQITITGSDVNHIKNVLRMRIGEEISLSNGVDGKEYRCGIECIEEDRILCTLRFIKEDGVELPSKVYLFQGLPKSDKMELIIQKAVELGVYEVIPVAAKRAVVKLDAKKAKSKRERWQTIAESAAKQSKRGIIPNIKEVMTMKEAISYAADMEVKLIPYELAEGMQGTKDIISSLKRGEPIAIFIGPEGGFEEGEIQEAKENGIVPITLGKRILRTETAGFTILAWIMYQLEE
ncbi:16S rRNA (uracil(1498)-N(3))-methyltransferase [Kineothrix sp. MB12-C1]|uniref:16S rRNA (uracil(1498)-N(3))-methyltransferase n=1 Tax=Kineothrix sp. MB12-C1 TaxID=3070215 RepID=UPI0027D1F5AD|nr:16S rRNA (uracil(1498)-N(3))-methyltransferase [Kineothrix sp. MB12-C1]WMC91559.1 16S rRNA (uracil(1498)-N(3))-methyltransferase [Kineothrix sp. MB12-C1]